MEKQQNPKEEKKSNKPVMQFRAGSVQASIWKQDGKYDTPFYNVSLKRSYKDAESGEWKETSSYNAQDVPKAILVLQKAYEWITLKEQEQED